MTQRNALDLIFDFSPKFKQVYQVYQGILETTREKDESVLHDVIYNYHPTRSAMDTAVSTLNGIFTTLRMSVISVTPMARLKELIVKLKN